jgi:hypothetical protein
MTYGEPARSYAIAAAVNLSKFNSYSGMRLSRPQNAISAANRILVIR